jgi:hypothetical protein
VEKISYLLGSVQRCLFPYLHEVVGELSTKEQELVLVLEVVGVERHVNTHHWLGRNPSDRKALARAFVAKAFYNMPTTRDLLGRLRRDRPLRRLCGWESWHDVPSESTFSRTFGEFAGSGLTDRVHEALVGEYVADNVVWHVSRDSTSVEAREKPVKKDKQVPKPKYGRGRPRSYEQRPKPEKTRLEKQLDWTLEQCLAELPTACDTGTKKNSKGYAISWTGYKFHVDIGDGGIPLSALTTSASLHDSQVAIPLMKMTASRVDSLYELMDSAYDAELIRQLSRDLGHVSIIDRVTRSKKQAKPEMEPDRAQRYNNRTSAERFNSELKDNHGGLMLRVRGNNKVHTHLMFGLLVIFAKAVIGLVS